MELTFSLVKIEVEQADALAELKFESLHVKSTLKCFSIISPLCLVAPSLITLQVN